jgi:hypothetical protein
MTDFLRTGNPRTFLGSAGASRAGDGALAIANFWGGEEVAAGRRNLHAWARALPRLHRGTWAIREVIGINLNQKAQ